MRLIKLNDVYFNDKFTITIIYKMEQLGYYFHVTTPNDSGLSSEYFSTKKLAEAERQRIVDEINKRCATYWVIPKGCDMPVPSEKIR